MLLKIFKNQFSTQKSNFFNDDVQSYSKTLFNNQKIISINEQRHLRGNTHSKIGQEVFGFKFPARPSFPSTIGSVGLKNMFECVVLLEPSVLIVTRALEYILTSHLVCEIFLRYEIEKGLKTIYDIDYVYLIQVKTDLL